MSVVVRRLSAQRVWLTAPSRVCRCPQPVQLRRSPSSPFSSFAFLSRVSKQSTLPGQPPSSSPSAAPRAPPTRTPSTSSGATTVVPDSSSPYMQEDATLERIALVGYGPDHFEVFNPSSLPQSSSSAPSPPPLSTPPAAGAGEDEASSVAVTASVVSSVAAPATRSGVLSRGVFSAPNTISMFGGVIALPTAAFLWAPTQWDEVTVESLAILDLLQQKPDLILFGTGSRIRPLPPSVSSYLQQLGIGYEVLQSNNALATFNMLAEEERLVMAAMVPYGEDPAVKRQQDEKEERPSAALRRRIEEQLAEQSS